jgi:Tfp pilus assembly protein PilN
MTQQINLLDPSLLPARDWCTASLIVGVGLALAAALIGQIGYERHAMARLLAAPGDSAAVDGAAPADAELADLQQAIDRDEALLRSVGSLVDLPQGSAAQLRDLFAVLPETLWLHEVELGAARSLRIRGSTLQPQALTVLAQRLNGSPSFRGAALQVLTLQRESVESSADAKPADVPYVFVLGSNDSSVAGIK